MASAAGLHTRSGFDTGDSLVAAPSAEDEPRAEVLYGDREDIDRRPAGYPTRRTLRRTGAVEYLRELASAKQAARDGSHWRDCSP